ncbi:MAG: DUF5672 family protein [Sphingomonas bacterium]
MKSAAPGLALPDVTLCAVTSVNVAATVRALEASMAQVHFGTCKLLTDVPVRHPAIEVVPIARLTSAAAYSRFMLGALTDHVETPYCLVVQWDGHVLSSARWRSEFLEYDYIGARWPQFSDGRDVGNGGFSLRSRRLLEACGAQNFRADHPEDIAICRTNRAMLEARGLRFAPAALADLFAAERAGDPSESFGYHGVFNMPRAIGVESFWQVYRQLDERSSVHHDFRHLLREVGRGRERTSRAARMIADRIGAILRD